MHEYAYNAEICMVFNMIYICSFMICRKLPLDLRLIPLIPSSSPPTGNRTLSH